MDITQPPPGAAPSTREVPSDAASSRWAARCGDEHDVDASDRVREARKRNDTAQPDCRARPPRAWSAARRRRERSDTLKPAEQPRACSDATAPSSTARAFAPTSAMTRPGRNRTRDVASRYRRRGDRAARGRHRTCERPGASQEGSAPRPLREAGPCLIRVLEEPNASRQLLPIRPLVAPTPASRPLPTARSADSPVGGSRPPACCTLGVGRCEGGVGSPASRHVSRTPRRGGPTPIGGRTAAGQRSPSGRRPREFGGSGEERPQVARSMARRAKKSARVVSSRGARSG